FRELLHKSAHSPKELLAVTAIFSLFALFSTWSGVPVEGSLVNVRIIAEMKDAEIERSNKLLSLISYDQESG
ncbi:LytS/YhcK type 5TM receptor domain-containing protein, partial [Escherichia sp. R-CC3]